MAEQEFNLLVEPWIRVMRKEDCQVIEISLTDALVHAHEYRGLAGELPTQDAAVMRLLLAAVHAVFGRVDINGEPIELETEEDAMEHWNVLWENGCFPEEPLKAYFQQQTDNFWLFDPEKPFGQVPSAVTGTEYGAKKLNGCLSESENKVRLFAERTLIEKETLTYGEAARWLLHVNAFDDTSAKPSKAGKMASGKLPSPGAGWVGKIGFICLTGNTLFETLMRNFVLTDINRSGDPWESCIPSWELKKPRSGERVEIPVPKDQAALLTLQSRRLLLKRENGKVVGYYLLGGDFFEKQNAFAEQMTVWGAIKDKKGKIEGYQPRRHKSSRQMWRDFSTFIPGNEEGMIPGVIKWNMRLQRVLGNEHNQTMSMMIASAQYGDKDFFIADIFSDELMLHYNLLSELGAIYRKLISDMVERCDRIAQQLGWLAVDLHLASGASSENSSAPRENVKEQFYSAIDTPFRQWLSILNADDDSEVREKRIDEWCKESFAIAMKLADYLVKEAGQPAFVGRKVAVDKDKKMYYSSSIAMQKFKYMMMQIEGRK